MLCMSIERKSYLTIISIVYTKFSLKDATASYVHDIVVLALNRIYLDELHHQCRKCGSIKITFSSAKPATKKLLWIDFVMISRFIFKLTIRFLF